MEPTNFDKANLILGPPPGVSEDNVRSLYACRGVDDQGRQRVISCWKVTQAELEEIQRTGRVWVHVLSSRPPPIHVSGHDPWGTQYAQESA